VAEQKNDDEKSPFDLCMQYDKYRVQVRGQFVFLIVSVVSMTALFVFGDPLSNSNHTFLAFSFCFAIGVLLGYIATNGKVLMALENTIHYRDEVNRMAQIKTDLEKEFLNDTRLSSVNGVNSNRKARS